MMANLAGVCYHPYIHILVGRRNGFQLGEPSVSKTLNRRLLIQDPCRLCSRQLLPLMDKDSPSNVLLVRADL